MLDLSHLASLIDSKTEVVSITGVANALGSKSPVDEVFKLARKVDAYCVLDAVHTVGHLPLDVERVGCDFAVFSAYKLFSRRGSFMYGRRDLLEKLKPYKVEPAPNDPPEKWEMGTRDQALFASISAVIDYLSWLGREVEEDVEDKVAAYSGRRRLLKAALSWIEKYEQTLSNAMLNGTDKVQGMNSMKRLELYGLKDPSTVDLRVPTFSFNIVGADPYKVAEYMWDKHSVAVLAEDNGGFYSRALRTYGRSVGIRASPVHFNTIEEVETFLTGLNDAVEHFT
jgi:selenocysteine lyase/cysteine desulfurase